MKMDFALPALGLRDHISAYYLHRFDAPLIEDSERADVGYLRFMFEGNGHIRHREGGVVHSSPVMLVGPSTETAPYTITGPLRAFGCVLLPPFWGGLVDISAENAANFSLDGTVVMGPEALACFNDLVGLDDVEAMGRRVDAFLLPRIKPLSSDHLKVIALIGEWLSQSPIPSTDTLYNRAALSARQVMRIANRYYGASPKMLARKFRALRTASKLIGSRGRIPEALYGEYADQAHMVREVKHFTGLTPRNLQITSNPIMQITLHPDNFRYDAPWT